MGKTLLSLTSLSGLIAVVMGAFGAHALESKLEARLFSAYQTAVEYQFIHTLALLAVALLLMKFSQSNALKVAGVAFAVGIVLFSGSLYALAFGAPRWLGPITPLGGISFMVGWISLFVSSRRLQIFV